MIKCIIFDLDGTILNSKQLRIEAWKHAFEKFGINLNGHDISPLIGLPGPDLAGKFSPKAFEIEMEEERYFRSHLDRLALYDDVDPTMKKMELNGIKTAIVTSSRKAFLDILKLPYNPVVTIDDVEVGKPDPEPYLKALSLMNEAASDCMVVGDAETDLIPAKTIGAVSVLIGHGSSINSDFADYYVDEISEVETLLGKLNGRKDDGEIVL